MVYNIKRVMKLTFEIDGRLVTLYYLTAAVGAVSPFTAAFLLKLTIDYLIKTQQITPGYYGIPSFVLIALGGYFMFKLFELIAYWGLNVSYYDYVLRNKLQSGLMYRFVKKLGSLDLGHLENAETQNLITKVHDSYQWQIPDFLRTWNYLFTNILGFAVACFTTAAYGWWIPVMVILVTIPRFYLKLKHGNFVWSMYGSGAPEAKKLWYYGWLLSEKEPILETRVFQSQPALLKKMKETQDYLYEINKKPLDNYRWVLIFAPILETGTVFAIVYLILPSILSGAVSIGSLTFLLVSLEQLKACTSWGAAHIGELYEKSLFIGPYFELMSLPQLIKEKKGARPFKKNTPPIIEFKNVSFTYLNGKEVLKNISFTVNPGENIAFVGNNGAGKSTIIKLLCRFYDVCEGEILINGVNLKEIKLSDWYDHLGTLFQDFMKFNFTIKENIMLGNPKIHDEKRMVKAAEDSGAIEFIEKFPEKYNQVLGRRFDGEELSGGQWQKLAIARAFYQDAPVLIMDEPTSAIDSEAEYEIFTNLERRYRDKTLILVSHRFSTVRNANKIIVIENGEITEQGSHDELIRKDGKYATMFKTQAKGYQ